MPEFTQNGHFVIDGGKLYKRQTHAAVVTNHSPDLLDTKDFTPPGGSKDTYVRLKSDSKYFLDCLVTAEDLINNVYPGTVHGTGGIRSQTVVGSTKFGEGHDENIALAKDLRKDHSGSVDKNTDPDVGQAYVTVSLYKTSSYPYHAAAVIAKDGTSRVTLEVFAAGTDASSRTFDGSYRIYSVTSGSGSTFHDTWSGNAVFRSSRGGTNEPVTLALKKK